MPDAPRSCPEQQRLMEKVQQHLTRIAELSHAAADAVANRNENLVRDLGKLENESAPRSAPWVLLAGMRRTRLLIGWAENRSLNEKKWVTFA
jgi:hypothetical protein